MTIKDATTRVENAILEHLPDEVQFGLTHPYLEGVDIYIKKEIITESVLGIPTRFYGNSLVIEDTADTIHNVHDVKLQPAEMTDYVNRLLLTLSLKEYHYLRKLEEKGLTIGSVIEFEDGKTAIIVPLSNECPDVVRALFYRPLKKDGTVSKIKPRILYGNTKFKILHNC